MTDHQIAFTYLSQEDLLAAGCFDIRMAIEVAEKTMLAYEDRRILFPEKIVQTFDQASQDRINCLPANSINSATPLPIVWSGICNTRVCWNGMPRTVIWP